MMVVDVTAIHPVEVMIGTVGVLIVIPKMDTGRNVATIGMEDQGVVAVTGMEVVGLQGTRVEAATGRGLGLMIVLAGEEAHHMMIATDARMPCYFKSSLLL